MSCEACKHKREYCTEFSGMIYCAKDFVRGVTPEGVPTIYYRSCADSLRRFRKHNHGRCPYFNQRHWYHDISIGDLITMVLIAVSALALFWSCLRYDVEVHRKDAICQTR